MIGQVGSDALEKGATQPLLSSEAHQDGEDDDQECDVSEELSEDSHAPVSSLKAAYKLLTPSVKVCFYTIHVNYNDHFFKNFFLR